MDIYYRKRFASVHFENDFITLEGVYDAVEHGHLSFVLGGGHGGSHPHLVHEFVDSIVNDRDPYPNAVQSANWTCVGLLAHESAMEGGVIKRLPHFTLSATLRK